MHTPRLLGPADIDAAMRLKESANWNQTRQDWVNVMRFSPEGCFGIEIDGTLAATATNVCFGDRLAWIGMVLTLPDYRGRGLARRLMEHSLEWIRSRGVDWIKLDATDMGRPLYASLGFEDECFVERWGRGEGEVAPDAVSLSEAPVPTGLDCEAVGADRSGLLELLAPMGTAALPGGYAMGRAGSKASYFGPCVARDEATARKLLRWHLSRFPGQAVYWDILENNGAAKQFAIESGFAPLRKLVRMAIRGNRPLEHNDALVFGIAGFEYG
jgi:GNAT superfamily N-acetyltransferase